MRQPDIDRSKNRSPAGSDTGDDISAGEAGQSPARKAYLRQASQAATGPLPAPWLGQGAAESAPVQRRESADKQVDDRVNHVDARTSGSDTVSAGIVQEDYLKILSLAEHRDDAKFAHLVGGFSPDYREKMKGELIRHHRFDELPLAMQLRLSPTSPFHQESQIDAGGAIYCTTAVRIEGVSAADVLRALTRTDWKEWWATSTTSGAPPCFDFIPEAPLKAIPGFHLNVQMGAAVAEGKNYRLPAKLAGTFSGNAEMYIESVNGGVVVHDTWLGMKLSNFVMEHAGGVSFWTSGHLDALRGAMAGGLLGATGFAGLREYLLGQKGISV